MKNVNEMTNEEIIEAFEAIVTILSAERAVEILEEYVGDFTEEAASEILRDKTANTFKTIVNRAMATFTFDEIISRIPSFAFDAVTGRIMDES